MVAVGIMAVAFLGMASVHAIAAKAQSFGQNEGLARFVADQQLELMRRTPVASIDAYTGTTTVQGVTFSIQRTVSNVTMGRRVTVTATWTDRLRQSAGPHSLTLTTIVSQVTNPS